MDRNRGYRPQSQSVMHRPPDTIESHSRRFYDRIQEQVSELQQAAGENEQVIILADTAGETVAIHSIGYRHPDLLLLYGNDRDGNSCVVIAHNHAVQLLVKTQKVEPHTERRPIGFVGERAPKAEGNKQ